MGNHIIKCTDAFNVSLTDELFFKQILKQKLERRRGRGVVCWLKWTWESRSPSGPASTL